MAVTDIELDVELLKKEVSDMKQIHGRLDTAITKITDLSNCINRMLAVHEEKISQQEEVPPKFGSPQIVRRFKYKHTHPIYPPMIWKHEGKTYLMPKWKEVMEGTTLYIIKCSTLHYLFPLRH